MQFGSARWWSLIHSGISLSWPPSVNPLTLLILFQANLFQLWTHPIWLISARHSPWPFRVIPEEPFYPLAVLLFLHHSHLVYSLFMKFSWCTHWDFPDSFASKLKYFAGFVIWLRKAFSLALQWTLLTRYSVCDTLSILTASFRTRVSLTIGYFLTAILFHKGGLYVSGVLFGAYDFQTIFDLLTIRALIFTADISYAQAVFVRKWS